MSVRYALTWGIIFVKLPTLLIGMILPIVGYYSLVSQNISLWYLALIIPIAFILAQFWWRFTIVKWKIWAYAKVVNLQELQASAQKIALIHDGQPLQHWEIVQQQDRPVLEDFRLQIARAKNQDDLSPSAVYYFSRTKIIASIFLLHLFPFMGILFLVQSGNKGIYWILGASLLVLYLLMYFIRLPLIGNPILLPSFQRLFSQKAQLILSPEGIHIQHQKTGFLPWKKIKNFQCTDTKTKQELLLFVQNTATEYQKILIPVEAYALDMEALKVKLSHYISLR